MGPEIERNHLDHSTAKDLLESVVRRALRYSPRLVKSALIGAVTAAMLVGLTFVLEEGNQAIPDTNRQYSREAISRGNRIIIDHAPFAIAGGAILGVIFGGAAPWMNRKLEELKPPE